MLGAAAWVAGCGGSEGAAVRVSRGAPQAFELGRWRSRARLTSSRVEAAVVAHGDRIHVLGGATAETGAVAPTRGLPPRRRRLARAHARSPGPVAGAGAATGQGRIYVAGGIDEAGRPLAEAHAYDSRTDAWTALPPLPRAAAAPSLVVVEDLLVALSGRRVWVLSTADLGAAAWMEGARPGPRSRPAAVAMANVVHVIGGREGREPSNRHDVYNPWGDEWFDVAPLPTARSSAAAAVLGGQALVAGGVGWDGVSRRAEAYDRRTDMWTSLAPLPTPRRGAGAAVLGRTLHVAGGGGRMPGTRHDVFTQ